MNTDPRYPIGKFKFPEQITADDRGVMMSILRDLPASMRMATDGLTEEQLLTPYREGGWSVAQVVHHVADSHMNAYIRFKLALTEENPTIRPYDENLWAMMPEAKSTEIGYSLLLLEALHARFVVMLENIQDNEWERTFYHPASNRTLRLDNVLALYSWHSEHHLAHITQLRGRMDW